MRSEKRWFWGNQGPVTCPRSPDATVSHDPGPQIGEGAERMEASLLLDSFPQWASAPRQVGTGAAEIKKAPSALPEL